MKTNEHSLFLDQDVLREAIREEYTLVAVEPGRGYHFHTGRALAQRLGYTEEWLGGIPETCIESFAGTGNPFLSGILNPGEKIVDVGSGAGFDSLIAARMVSPGGQVLGIDMTPAMVQKAKEAALEAAVGNVEFHLGYAESLPIEAGWADRIISNGVLNLLPDKDASLQEMRRVLKPGGWLQIGDILVQKAVPANVKSMIDLWTG